MAFLQLSEGRLAFGGRVIFEDVHLRINSGDRLALAGANGSGKSTLLKVLTGLQELDEGQITRSRQGTEEARTAYLPQSGISHQGRRVRELALEAFNPLKRLEEKAEALGRRLQEEGLSEKATTQLVEEHHRIQERLLEDGYYDRERRTEEVLTGLGFSPAQLDRRADTFSGGWQMRIALARILLSDPDILLLDEPTNYLDLEAREWLLGFINRYSGGLLIVSHDRYFMDRTINGVLELFQRKLKRFPGSYTNYEKLRKEENERLAKAYELQQEEIAKLEDFINRFRYNASKAPLVQSRVKTLEKIKRLEPPPGQQSLSLFFPDPPHSGKEALRLKDLSKAYGELPVIDELTLTVNRSEKMVVTGPNGAGKSTLLRIIAGRDKEYGGSLEWGSGISIGYFSQDHERELPGEETILSYMESIAPTALIPRIRDMLGALLFSGDDVHKKLKVLSGGEKSRISLLKLLLEPHNLLILDEPTNHLDIHSKDVLLDALGRYPGTLLFVSHDRYFIEGLATQVLELSPSPPPEEGQGKARRAGVHRLFPGDYPYYLDRKAREAAGEITLSSGEGRPPGGTKPSPGPGSEEAATATKLSHEESKKQRNQIRKKEREAAALMESQEAASQELSRCREEMTRPEIYSHPAEASRVQGEIETLTQRIAHLDEEWMTLEEELEELRAAQKA